MGNNDSNGKNKKQMIVITAQTTQINGQPNISNR